MRSRLVSLAAIVLLCGSLFAPMARAQAISESIRQAVAQESRPANDRARDGGRKPAEALAFFNIRPGMSVIEYGSGGGYFTELLSHAVGDQGRVLAQNPFIFFRFADGELNERYASGRLRNVAVIFGNPSLVSIPDNSLDAALFIDTYHDIAYAETSADAQPPIAGATLREARRVLRPGAVFGVIDHRARDGASRAEAAAIHRIVESTLRADFEAAGFVFDGALDIYVNPQDDRARGWFQDPTLRDNTDRLIHRYRSPD
jgi:predicted methyltransferase